MSVEFIDTNVLVYAYDGGAGIKHEKSVELVKRLAESGTGALSIQVLIEFCAIAMKKLLMTAAELEAILKDFDVWIIHRPSLEDLTLSARVQRRHQISWWDALIVNSAMQLESKVLWTEDLASGHRFGATTVRNPYRD